jgi:ABC-2 type transport system permease protein
MWRRIFVLVRKELYSIWRDPKTRSSLLLPPLIQLLVFTFAATLDVKNASIGILDLDRGKQSFEIIQRFKGSPTFRHITWLESVDAIVPFMDEQKGVMVVSFDQQFTRNLEAAKPARVELILDGRKSNSAQIVAGYATTILDNFSKEFAKANNIPVQNAQLVQRNWFNHNLLYYWYNNPSLVATISMLTALVVTSISVAREKELGTFDQLLVSPLMPAEIVIGKIIPGIIVGLLEASLMIFVGVFIFRVPFTGSLFLLFVSLFVFISAIGGIGLFISTIASTQQQAMLGTFAIMVPSILLSGFGTPIENMPSWLQPVTYLIPLKYMLVISKGIYLKAMPLKIVLKNLWPMAIIGICTLVGSGLLFRRRLE